MDLRMLGDKVFEAKENPEKAIRRQFPDMREACTSGWETLSIVGCLQAHEDQV